MRRPWPHLRGEHGDVVKLPAPPLFDRDRQEEAAAVFGEHRFLVLQDTQIFAELSSRRFMFRAVWNFTSWTRHVRRKWDRFYGNGYGEHRPAESAPVSPP